MSDPAETSLSGEQWAIRSVLHKVQHDRQEVTCWRNKDKQIAGLQKLAEEARLGIDGEALHKLVRGFVKEHKTESRTKCLDLFKQGVTVLEASFLLAHGIGFVLERNDDSPSTSGIGPPKLAGIEVSRERGKAGRPHSDAKAKLRRGTDAPDTKSSGSPTATKRTHQDEGDEHDETIHTDPQHVIRVSPEKRLKYDAGQVQCRADSPDLGTAQRSQMAPPNKRRGLDDLELHASLKDMEAGIVTIADLVVGTSRPAVAQQPADHLKALYDHVLGRDDQLERLLEPRASTTLSALDFFASLISAWLMLNILSCPSPWSTPYGDLVRPGTVWAVLEKMLAEQDVCLERALVAAQVRLLDDEAFRKTELAGHVYRLTNALTNDLLPQIDALQADSRQQSLSRMKKWRSLLHDLVEKSLMLSAKLSADSKSSVEWIWCEGGTVVNKKIMELRYDEPAGIAQREVGLTIMPGPRLRSDSNGMSRLIRRATIFGQPEHRSQEESGMYT